MPSLTDKLTVASPAGSNFLSRTSARNVTSLSSP